MTFDKKSHQSVSTHSLATVTEQRQSQVHICIGIIKWSFFNQISETPVEPRTRRAKQETHREDLRTKIHVPMVRGILFWSEKRDSPGTTLYQHYKGNSVYQSTLHPSIHLVSHSSTHAENISCLVESSSPPSSSSSQVWWINLMTI